MPPTIDNPRGYFESDPLRIAHDALLNSSGSHWDDWQQFDLQWFASEAGQQHRQDIKAILVNEFGNEPLIFVKDPRICRFMPFTLSALAELSVGSVAVLPLRNPLEVAYSLQRRDGFPLSKSILLWVRHVLVGPSRQRAQQIQRILPGLSKDVAPEEGGKSRRTAELDIPAAACVT